MKIASSIRKVYARSGSVLLGVLFLAAGGAAAHAADAASPSPALASIDPPAISGTTNTVTLSQPQSSANISAARARSLAPLEEKISDSAKNVVKQLSSIDTVNLDDLNTARQTVTKLELLIDIEKHLAELDKLHNEHNGEKSLAAAIPASALSPPPSLSSLPKFPVMAAAPVAAHSDVTRIMGAAGHYAAVVQGKTVRIGDTLPDGSSVVAISTKTVETKSKDGVMHTLKVKGVDEVFGHPL